VIRTGFFDEFMARNRLYDFLAEEHADDRIAHAFIRSELPPNLVGDLWAMMHESKQPLAVRSSSLLEDAKRHPFAGVYETKMTPNNQFEAEARFAKLTEAIKFVYASTFFRAAREYRRSVGADDADEKMAVIVQEVVGRRRGERFYPDLAGVARSYNYYRFGAAKPEDGVTNLALGLGKTIVDGGVSWTVSPKHPRADPPCNSLDELMDDTQHSFWAVNMGKPPAFDPTKETEYLVECSLSEAEADGALRLLASSYDAYSERLEMGLASPGPRVVTFAPILKGGALPLAGFLTRLLKICEAEIGSEVEIEFAIAATTERPARFGFLQVRPMTASRETVELEDGEMGAADLLLASDNTLGNGSRDDLRRVVYIKPAAFDLARTPDIARELGAFNQRLREAGEPYLLIGFGRWGSSDPWLGVPVGWAQISGARAIVEGMLESTNIDLSQGSHFFHNLNAFQVSYFSVRQPEDRIDWAWLDGWPVFHETELIRGVVLPAPLGVKVDGRRGRGVIRKCPTP
jgi:hypothetical protein